MSVTAPLNSGLFIFPKHQKTPRPSTGPTPQSENRSSMTITPPDNDEQIHHNTKISHSMLKNSHWSLKRNS